MALFPGRLILCLTFHGSEVDRGRGTLLTGLSQVPTRFLCTTDCILYTQQVLFNTQLMYAALHVNSRQGLANVHYCEANWQEKSLLSRGEPKGFNLLRHGIKRESKACLAT